MGSVLCSSPAKALPDSSFTIAVYMSCGVLGFTCCFKLSAREVGTWHSKSVRGYAWELRCVLCRPYGGRGEKPGHRSLLRVHMGNLALY